MQALLSTSSGSVKKRIVNTVPEVPCIYLILCNKPILQDEHGMAVFHTSSDLVQETSSGEDVDPEVSDECHLYCVEVCPNYLCIRSRLRSKTTPSMLRCQFPSDKQNVLTWLLFLASSGYNQQRRD